MHSYGGLPSGEAAKGFVKMQRERDGMKGGIVRLVYLCSLVLPEDASLMGPMNNEKAPWVEIDGDSIRLTDPTTAANTFYNDLDQATADYWASRLTHHSYPTFHCKVTYAAWRDIPSTYLYCEADNAIPLSMQEMMVQDAGGFQTERCSAGHSPFLSQPELVVDVIRRAAGETV
ncbi:MAG: hypothetical protein M1830_005074 [Pleopsidium flavum]|nr:MAG: hypothetical protein M1830_005074 [Pleopsidium flavum]